MLKPTLKSYLFDKRVELFEEVNRLKDLKLSDDFTERDTIDLEVAEGQLSIVKDVIAFCNMRKKF